MINIVRATQDHLHGILRIGQELISSAWTHDFLLNEFVNSGSSFFVALNNNDILGFIILRTVGDDGEILQIAVDKNEQRKGIGDLLISSAVDYAAENNPESIFLEVRVSNTAAESLYRKHGFETVRIRKDYYNNPVEDALVMVRRKEKRYESL